jgi:hypothetical protein
MLNMTTNCADFFLIQNLKHTLSHWVSETALNSILKYIFCTNLIIYKRLGLKVRFTQKMLVKCHSSEPFFAPGLLFPVNGMKSSHKMSIFSFFCIIQINLLKADTNMHGLRTHREETAFTARPKIQSQSQIFRYGRSIFCLPHFSDIFDLCLH